MLEVRCVLVCQRPFRCALLWVFVVRVPTRSRGLSRLFRGEQRFFSPPGGDTVGKQARARQAFNDRNRVSLLPDVSRREVDHRRYFNPNVDRIGVLRGKTEGHQDQGSSR